MNTRENAALRAKLVEKLLSNVVDLEQALKADSNNSFLRTLYEEQKKLLDYVKNSSISDSTLKEYLGILDEVAKERQKQEATSTTPKTIAAKATAATTPAQSSSSILDDSSDAGADNILGLDLEGVLGDILADEKAVATVFNTDTEDLLRIDGDRIVLEIDEELEQGIDEEAKMFEVEQHYRNKDYFKALAVALALNIRFKQGVGKRSDAIVRRQDEILFECNYRIGYDHLEKAKMTKGDEQVEHKLSAIMHFYNALDQQVLPGQEKLRQDMKAVIDKLIEREGVGGPAYIKAGLFKKIKVPAPEDKAQKSFYWKEKALQEVDLTRKEFYWLMTFASDINYYPYQIALANFYLEVNRLDEACRYIKVPLPLVENDGVDFLLTLRKKDAAYAEKFMERRFKSDTAQLRSRYQTPDKKELSAKDEAERIKLENQRFKKFIDTIDLWQKRMDAMKADVPFRNSTLRIEYTKAFAEILQEANKVRPDLIVRDFIERYRSTDVRSTQNPNILNFIDFSFRYAITPDEKSSTGLVVEGEAEAQLDVLSKAVLDYFNAEIGVSTKSIAETKQRLTQETEKMVKAMKELGYKFERMPILTKVYG
ncbi:MAG: hypothetical protein D0433_08370 [Candidatus Thermochlorobacter aerophilum]|uniref:Uncharacterized protein n=1 Tax=Candidatus Thermochlorobacter aerophilus TaxID=1868324 RepID=A0A395LZH5_9BACT|nr:MAG: hypothetical protein D0433_08370 [Candidatus Thermochlorobacter aerophilum]